MSDFSSCPKCGSRKDDDAVYECTNCGKRFCEGCGDGRFGDVCPGCDGTGRKIGEIS